MSDWAWPFIVPVFLVLAYFLGTFDRDPEIRIQGLKQTIKYFVISMLVLLVIDYIGVGAVDEDPPRPADIYNE